MRTKKEEEGRRRKKKRREEKRREEDFVGLDSTALDEIVRNLFVLEEGANVQRVMTKEGLENKGSEQSKKEKMNCKWMNRKE